MNKLLLALAVASTCAATPCITWAEDAAAAQEKGALRVLCFNIHHCEGIDGELDVERIARLIRQSDPDLVALQEVDVKTERSEGVDQAAELARLCEMEYRFGKTIDYQGGLYGNAVLSRLPITAVENIPLPRHEGEQRALLMVQVMLDDDQPLWFVATHFDNAKPQARLESAAQLKSIVEKQTIPVIVAGDLNCTVDSEPFARLTPVLQRPDQQLYPTVPVRQPTRQIDFILFDRGSQWTFLETKVIDPESASDHRPILTEVRLR